MENYQNKLLDNNIYELLRPTLYVKNDNISSYILKINCLNKDNCYGDLLYIHGAPTCVPWGIKLYKSLSKYYNVYVPYLPGSSIEHQVNIDSFGETDMDVVSYYILYIDSIVDYITNDNNTKLCLVGHSFGAYLCINYLIHYHDKINKICLIAPIGIYPTSNIYTYYYAFYNKYNIYNNIKYFKKKNIIGKYVINYIDRCILYSFF